MTINGRDVAAIAQNNVFSIIKITLERYVLPKCAPRIYKYFIYYV